ncbi:hypothetical protein YB2330_006182 [Saitoella coloradoensis]
MCIDGHHGDNSISQQQQPPDFDFSFPTDDILIALDSDLRITAANDNALSAFRAPTRRDLLNLRICDLLSDGESFAAQLAELARRRGTIRIETDMIRGGDPDVSISWRIRVHGGDGDGYRVVGRRKLAEREEWANRLSDMAMAHAWLRDNVNDVLRRWDITTSTISWDAKMQFLTGYEFNSSNGETTPEWWRDRIHTDDVDRVWESVQRFMKGHGVFWCEEYRFRCADNTTYITLVDQLHLTRSPTGAALLATGALFNPVQRRQVADILETPRTILLRDIPHGHIKSDDLRHQTMLIKTITDNSPSGLILKDAKGYPTYINPAASRITGYAFDDIKDKPLHYSIHYKHPDGRAYPMEDCPVDGSQVRLQPQKGSTLFVRHDGSFFPSVWSNSPLEGRDGRSIGAVLEFRDVTEEREMEKERLQAMVDAEQGLIRAREAEWHKMKLGEFIDYVCHEIRNPLHGIAANTGFLAEHLDALKEASSNSKEGNVMERLVKDCTGFLTSIRECVNHQALITNNVLDLSRLDAGKVELDSEVFEVESVAGQSVDMLRANIIEKKLDVRIEGGSSQGLGLVKGDSTRLRQVFINLLSNAIKFTPRGKRIVVRYAVDEEASRSANLEAKMGGVGIMDGGHHHHHHHHHEEAEAKAKCTGNEGVEFLVLRASVEDTGLGMTDDEQKWLFKRFSQTSKKISATYGGSGLGLNICYELVKLLGGEITVRSSKDVGTSFEFTVKLTRPSACEVQDYGRLHVPMATLHQKSLGRFGRVLIAEDNAINQKIMAKYMTQLELEYTIVDNGLKAVEAYTSLDPDADVDVKPFDFVIMDMEMPVLDGRQATVAIREWEEKNGRKRVPLVALSGNARKEQVEHAFGCGVDDYLTKPCKLDALRSMVQKWQGVEGAVRQSS